MTSLKNHLIYIELLVSFISLPLWIAAENRAKLKKLFNFNNRLRWGGNTPDTQNTLIIFLSAIAVMQVIFGTEDFIQLENQKTY